VLCPHCEKQVPDTLYCQSCGKQLLPDEGEEQDPEEPAHEVTDNEKKWLGTPVKDLRKLREVLLVEEVKYLLEHETRKSAQGLLHKQLESFAEAIPVEDD
ncbi:MAG: hypothetical protein JRC68_10385, partial [Deltaproteobacteria bacterium]|nr:hypothetical protein [Deltaproteobacteria bacterium]